MLSYAKLLYGYGSTSCKMNVIFQRLTPEYE